MRLHFFLSCAAFRLPLSTLKSHKATVKVMQFPKAFYRDKPLPGLVHSPLETGPVPGPWAALTFVLSNVSGKDPDTSRFRGTFGVVDVTAARTPAVVRVLPLL